MRTVAKRDRVNFKFHYKYNFMFPKLCFSFSYYVNNSTLYVCDEYACYQILKSQYSMSLQQKAVKKDCFPNTTDNLFYDNLLNRSFILSHNKRCLFNKKFTGHLMKMPFGLCKENYTSRDMNTCVCT